jgi:hypothetical protein
VETADNQMNFGIDSCCCFNNLLNPWMRAADATLENELALARQHTNGASLSAAAGPPHSATATKAARSTGVFGIGG